MSKEPFYRRFRAKALDTIETVYETIDKGSIVEGFMNSYHLMGCYSLQVEVQGESGGVEGCSGIYVVNVPIDIKTILPIEQEGPSKPSDYDIENAANEYAEENQHQRRSSYGKLHKAYTEGARDMRDKNIYISPSSHSIPVTDFNHQRLLKDAEDTVKAVREQFQPPVEQEGQIKDVCPKCNGKGWYFVDEWIGPLQGRKDCDCLKKEPQNNNLLLGWTCLRCGKSHSPFSTQCDCPSRSFTSANTVQPPMPSMGNKQNE